MGTEYTKAFPIGEEGGAIPARLMLLPAGGNVQGRDGRAWRVRNAAELAQASNDYMPQHCIDENHATDLQGANGGQSPALGWFSNITADADGSIWADAEWTERGKAALAAKEYRYLSPVLKTDAQGNITAILRAALTNTPNIPLPALNSEKEQPETLDDKAVFSVISDVLGRDFDTVAEMAAYISALKDIAEGRKGTRQGTEEMNSEAVNTATELNAMFLVDSAVRDGIITPANRDRYIQLCTAQGGLEAVKEIIRNTPPALNNTRQVPDGSPQDLPRIVQSAAEKEYISHAGYSAEEWEDIKRYANKRK